MNQRDVTALTDAYRSALAEGDRSLQASPLERKVLHALVTESASKTAFWIKTRVKGGPAAVGPLNELLDVAVPADMIGQALAQARQAAFNQAKAVLSSLLTQGTAPLWVGAIGAAVVGFVGFAHQLGLMLGGALFALLATGGSARYVLMRGIQLAPNAIAGSAQNVVRSIGDARGVGVQAEQIFEQTAGPAIDHLYAAEGGVNERLTVASTLRGTAVSAVTVAWIVLGIGVGIMLFGAYEGFSAASESATTSPF
jgi:hypothetical protein